MADADSVPDFVPNGPQQFPQRLLRRMTRRITLGNTAVPGPRQQVFKVGLLVDPDHVHAGRGWRRRRTRLSDVTSSRSARRVALASALSRRAVKRRRNGNAGQGARRGAQTRSHSVRLIPVCRRTSAKSSCPMSRAGTAAQERNRTPSVSCGPPQNRPGAADTSVARTAAAAATAVSDSSREYEGPPG